MAVKLGELLIKKNQLTQAQLEEALQAQVIFGGKLGTVLIEMGLITEDALAEILAQLLSIPCAKPGQLQNIPENIIKIISPELAEKHKVIPVAVSGKKLTLNVGYSNPVEFDLPENVSGNVDNNTTIVLESIDKEALGLTAAQIRAIRKPEPYKGKGIRYENEYIQRKAGKTGAAAAA